MFDQVLHTPLLYVSFVSEYFKILQKAILQGYSKWLFLKKKYSVMIANARQLVKYSLCFFTV